MDPLLELMNKRLELDAKKEQRKQDELTERLKENRIQLQLLQMLAASQGIKTPQSAMDEDSD